MRVTKNKILDLARTQIGYTEHPPNSNRSKYGAAIGLDGQPWCMSFLMWLFDQLGARDMLPIRTGSCSAFLTAAKKAMPAQVHPAAEVQPGDLIIYTFGHCGICESITSGRVKAIEGNTGIGNDANGGKVMRRDRSVTQIRAVFRPAYKQERHILSVVQDVLDGKYGNGDTRREALEREGLDPKEVQRLVNAMSRGGVKVLVTARPSLNIREKPNVQSRELDRFATGATAFVDRVSNGNGASAWGCVGSGWIALDYVKVV